MSLGVDVNTRDPYGKTPLYIAASLSRDSYYQTIKRFLKKRS